MNWRKWTKIIGILLLVYIFSEVHWKQVFLAIGKLRAPYLVGYGACFLAMVLVRIIRLYYTMARIGHAISFRDCYIATLEPAFMGLVTPGRLGEFARVGYLQTYGAPLSLALSIVMFERLVDVGILLFVGLEGVFYIFSSRPYQILGGVVTLSGLILFYLSLRGYKHVFQWLKVPIEALFRFMPNSLKTRQQALRVSLALIMNRTTVLIFLLGLLCIVLNLGQIFMLGKAFGFEADYLVIVFAYAAATLVSLLPISVGGLGTREATYIFIMGCEGILKEQALLFSLLDGLVFGIVAVALLLLPLWISRLVMRQRNPTRTVANSTIE